MISPLNDPSLEPVTTWSDHELVTWTLGRGFEERALHLLARYGGVAALARAGVGELCTEPLDLEAVLRLKAAIELGRRSIDKPLLRGAELASALAVSEALRAHVVGREQEEVHVLGVDSSLRLIAHFVAAVGSACEVLINPREVFRPLIRENAYGAIVVHNHPAGSTAPSPSDHALTRQLDQAGRVVGIPLLDHIILGLDGHFSFFGNRLLP